jgi:hypothetical protein
MMVIIEVLLYPYCAFLDAIIALARAAVNVKHTSQAVAPRPKT